jgi:hypothetical protein
MAVEEALFGTAPTLLEIADNISLVIQPGDRRGDAARGIDGCEGAMIVKEAM